MPKNKIYLNKNYTHQSDIHYFTPQQTAGPKQKKQSGVVYQACSITTPTQGHRSTQQQMLEILYENIFGSPQTYMLYGEGITDP